MKASQFHLIIVTLKAERKSGEKIVLDSLIDEGQDHFAFISNPLPFVPRTIILSMTIKEDEAKSGNNAMIWI